MKYDPVVMSDRLLEEIKAKYDAHIGEMKASYSNAVTEALANMRETIRDYERIAEEARGKGDFNVAIEFHSKAYGLIEAQKVLIMAMNKHDIRVF